MKPNSLDDNIVYQCSDFTHQFSGLLKAEFQRRKLAITPEQLSILVSLWYKGKATQQEISGMLRRDKTTIARVVQNMEKRGLLSFTPHPTDKRSRLVSLTRKGEQTQNAAIQVSGALYTRVLKGIEQADLRIALKVLAQLTRNCAVFILCWLTAVQPLRAQSQMESIPSLARKYKIGDTYRYRLTCETYRNGKWSETNVSFCNLIVTADSAGQPGDLVTWDSLTIFTPTDTTDASAKARSTKPYRISLVSHSSLALPPLIEPVMTEPISDFHTFFVAIASMIGIDSLHKVGDSTRFSIPVIGKFANGKNILVGEDCLSITLKLTGLQRSTAMLQTSFLPPAAPNLSYLLPEMKTPVVPGIQNNFQMVMPGAPQKFHIQYGREYFNINSMVSTADGKLTKADMFNQLTLKLKVNCDDGYQHCQAEFPMNMERKLTLELLRQGPAFAGNQK